MKKFPLLFAAVAIIAVGSAFAMPREMDPSDIYVPTSQGMKLKADVEDEGQCRLQANTHCEYTKDAQGDFIPADNDRVWTPNP